MADTLHDTDTFFDSTNAYNLERPDVIPVDKNTIIIDEVIYKGDYRPLNSILIPVRNGDLRLIVTQDCDGNFLYVSEKEYESRA